MAELLALAPPQWLIDGVLPAGGHIGLYGPPGSLKSFIALDMALSVASGTPWQSHEVARGFVLYVAAEGGAGNGKRARAWTSQHPTLRPNDFEISFLLEGVSIAADGPDIHILMERLDEIDRTPSLVVIDTLARCLEGDENQQEDMGRFIKGVDKFRQDGATVLSVHHTRLDGDRERGNTAYRGATDAMIEAKRDGDLVILSNNKQKDAEEFAPIRLLKQIVPEHDSCVIVSEAVTSTEIIRRILLDAGEPLTYGDLATRVTGGLTPMSLATLKRHLVSLVKSGEILKENGVYYII
jgi:hypothetical protein